APARSLVLEGEVSRHLPSHVFDDGADRRAGGFESVQRTDFGSPFVSDVLIAKRGLEGGNGDSGGSGATRATAVRGEESIYGWDTEDGRDIRLPIDGMVPLTGGGGVESATRITDIGADEIAKRAVDTFGRGAAGRVVVAGAIGFAGSDIVADPGAVLAWRVQNVPLKAAHI